jgi:hypothetical protein
MGGIKSKEVTTGVMCLQNKLLQKHLAPRKHFIVHNTVKAG